MSGQYTIHVDGACSGNPGAAGIGVVIRQDEKVIKEISKPIGDATNNIAEYSAMIHALEEAEILGASTLKIFTDSELVYKQLIGRYQVKNAGLRPLYEQARALAAKFDRVDIQHIRREFNQDADRLATQSIKQKQAKAVAPLFHCSGEESPSSKG